MKTRAYLIIATIAALTAIVGCSTCPPQLSPPVTVFGLPVASNGKQGTCPGKYAGYVIYTNSTAWGWTPDTASNTVFAAADGGGRADTKVVYNGQYGDAGCATAGITIPNPPMSPQYRFAIYFPNNVPTTNYPINLTGFNQ